METESKKISTYDVINAASKGRTETVKVLLNQGADIDAKNNNGDTALMLAAEKGHKNICQLLLDKGADIHAKNNDGDTALMLAAEKGHKNICQLLLDRGADIHAKDNYGWTDLMAASYGGRTETAQLLIVKGADIHTKNNYGWTALMIAAGWGHTKIITLILDRGADIHTKDNDGRNALMIAALTEEVENFETVKILIDRGADIHDKNNTALIAAAQNGHTEISNLLLERGVDINAKNNYGYTALIEASQWGYTEMCKLLLNRGADVNAKNNYGETALMKAKSYDDDAPEVSLLLIEHGIEIPDDKTNIIATLSNFEWWTDAHSSIINNDVPQEITYSLEVDSGITLLYLALICGNLPATEMVIDSDSYNLNECLRIAVFAGREKIVKYLLECGADPRSKNIKDQTALHIACARGHAQTLTLLMNKIIEREEQAKYSEGINCFSFWGKESQVNQLETKTEADSSSGIQNLGLIR